MPQVPITEPIDEQEGLPLGCAWAGDGVVVAQYEYGPFGELLRASSPLARSFNFLFSTKYFDWETGLSYYGHRYYNPTTGRWLSRDPIGEYGGINLYAYVVNDPLNFVDPYGLWSFIRWLYTGDGNASDEVYNAATEAAGDYIYYCGGVRGGYIGLGIGGKVKGKGSIAGAVGFTGTWTVDDGAAISLDVGVGLQERGRNSCGRFASQTIGVGGGYQFWIEMDGFQNPTDGLAFGGIYGGTAESG